MNILWIAVSFVLVAFGQPAWVRSFGVLAAAFGFAIFWRAMLCYPSQRDRFILSLIWFACVQGVQLSWMATTDYMGPLIWVMYLFLILAMGVQFAIVSSFLNVPAKVPRALAMAGCWVIFEWSRLFFLCGFTWNPVGLALADSPYSLQFAGVWGIFGLSFWVILVNAAALNALTGQSAKRVALWALLALFPYGYGVMHQKWIETTVPISSTLNIALVQTGLLPEQKDLQSDAIHDYIQPLDQWRRILGVLDPEKKVDLIILPEAALPMEAHRAAYHLNRISNYFKEEYFPPLREPYAALVRGTWKVSNAFMLQTLANQSQAHVITGLDDHDDAGRYNAAFHFSPNNSPVERYEKRILVPIGEYVPLREWKRFARFVSEQFGIYDSFKPGKEVKIFHAQVPLGVSICLEETFSNLTRELRLNGAEVFVNLTNDVWFPRSKLPRQHFDHGRVRAAENGVAILRACNTGVTGAVDCFGAPIEQLPISESDASALYFSMPVRSYKTLYTLWGDAGILAVSVAAMIPFFWIRKKKLP